MFDPRFKYARWDSLITASFDLHANRFGKADRIGLFHAYDHSLYIILCKANPCQVVCQCFNGKSRCAFGVCLDFLGHLAVVSAIVDIVRFGGAMGVGVERNVDEDILCALALPISDADDSAGEQVFDDDFVHVLGFLLACV